MAPEVVPESVEKVEGSLSSVSAARCPVNAQQYVVAPAVAPVATAVRVAPVRPVALVVLVVLVVL